MGCPPDIFYTIGEVLEAGKRHQAGLITLGEFQVILKGAEAYFRQWDRDQAAYPTAHPEWGHLADAYRHACLLRVLRWPDTFAVPCEDERVKASVTAILDACASIPRTGPFYKRLLFPLFLAGVDTSSAHQVQYVAWCIDEIKRSTGLQHQAMTELLYRVWEERKVNTNGWPNVPWMEFVSIIVLSCLPLSRHQV